VKNVQHSMTLKNWNLKQQWDNITPLTEWIKFKTLTTANSGQDMKKWKLSLRAGGNTKWYTCLESFFSFSYH
jgi:hypothetical protein